MYFTGQCSNLTSLENLYKDINLVVITYSIGDRKSLKNAETEWWHGKHKKYGKEVPCVLLGLKEDQRKHYSNWR
jgi:GTPase SAR1 family protein